MSNAKSLAATCLLLVVAAMSDAVEVVTQHFDNARTGANTQEAALTTAAVNQAGFGKLFTTSFNANVNGQALYVPGLSIGGSTHNTGFAYTSNNSNGSACGLYAFDADTGAVLWSRTLTNAAQYTTNTPVIDSAAKTMYFVSKDNDNNGINWIHAVDITTGAEKTGSPAQIGGSVAGTGDGTSGGTVTFPATHANCRPGILLMNGVLYLGFSFNSDARPYHGWVLSYTYNGSAFTQTHIFCVSPNKEAGGIWQAGKGLVGDGTFVYCTTGNGSFDNNLAAGSAFGMCFLRLNSSLQVADFFAEASESGDSNSDLDLGNCGPLMIPGTSVLFAGGTKYGRGHVVDAANMGHFNSSTDACLQTITSGLGNSVGQNPVGWDGGGAGKFVYVWSNGHGIAQYQYDGTTRHFTNSGGPVHTSAATNGGSLCVSSNGTGGGILWAAGNDGVVHAYDATNVATELWNSSQNSARDSLGSVGHFQFPMVAAGKLYVPTGNGKLVAYGRLSVQTATKLAIIQQPGSVSAGAAITPAVKVAIEDAGGATVTSATNAVTIAIAANPGAGTLAGTTTVNAVSGVATFSNLSINNAGTGYTLATSSAGLTGATTSAFNILAQVATPTLNPNGGTFSGPVTVRLADATSGATIRYTTDGSTPTGASTAYSAPFALAATATVKAIAQKSGMTDSAQASAAFTVTGSTPYGMPYRPAVSGVTLPANLSTSPPSTLSGTGVFSSLVNLTPVGGIVPYNVNTPLWSDSAVKQRWAALPGTSQIVFQSTGEWSFPGGTFFIKHFELGTDDTNPAIRKRLETRILYVNASAPNNGYGITYKWRADNSDADLVASAGLDEAITITTATGTRSQTWHYPSQGECLTCHTSYSGFVLGPKTRQLNGSFTYPSTGNSDNQLRTWNYLQMFTTNIGEGNIAGFSRSKAVGDTTATLEDRVKSYVDANCAQCHRPGGVATNWDARYDTPMANQGIINGAVKTDLGITGAKVVTPQNTALSMMHVRMNSTVNTTKMPPLARNLVDTAALAVLDQWINGLPVSGNGLKGEYWTNQDKTFTGAATLTRTDAAVNFDWGTGSPDPSISVDHFTARWTGQVQAQFSETYTFYTTSDDGVRLWVNNQLLIDQWIDQSPTEWSGAIALVAGQKYDVKMEFYENGGGAVAKLSWSSPSTPKAIIPQSQLSPTTGMLFAAKVNFQPAAAPVYGNGYVVDSSQVYGDRGNGFTYGWNLAFDETRDRNNASSPDQRYDTFDHMQKPSNPNAVWEIAVPNGTYQVHLVSGDSDNIDSVFKINVEGVLVLSGTPAASPASAHWIDSGTQTVVVSDGRLTVSNASGAANNKICFIEIQQVPGGSG